MREKYGGSYFPLVCGHYGDTDTDAVYRDIQPKNKHWCENCSKWSKRVPRKRRAPAPDTPLF